VLISIANAMGVTVNSFGSGAFAATSALAGLTA
jgi:branched-subunit amino acid ABC-type transport system permease component